MSEFDTPPDALVDEFLAVAERLTEVVAAETEALSHPGAPDLTRLSPEKSNLAVRYEGMMQRLAEHPPIAIRATQGGAQLAASIRRLDALAQDNARAIELHLTATRRVLDMVARAARKATQPNFSYGTERLGYGVRSPRNAAIAINRVL